MSSFKVGLGATGLDYTLDARPPATGTKVEFLGDPGYRITRNDGQTVGFNDSHIVSSAGDAYHTQWRVTSGGIQNDVVLTKVGTAAPGAFALTYHVIGAWTQVNTGNPGDLRTNEFFLFGNKTVTLPSGSATYKLDKGIGLTGHDRTFTAYNFQPNSTGTLTANFGAGSVATTLHLIGKDEITSATKDFGTFNGTATITSGADFAGTWGGTTGRWYGSFFGPNAEEVGYTTYLETPTMEAVGTVSGVKQ
ncbi:transferrin-binding protein-like solute binding protein [Tsuneonella sp. HG222]